METSGFYLFLGYTKQGVKNNRFFVKVNSTLPECSIVAIIPSSGNACLFMFLFF